jgi:magnesium transporter
MFRVFEVNAEGKCQNFDSTLALPVCDPSTVTWYWIDCTGPTRDELALLQERYGFHSVAIEDCAKFDHRPKFVPYDDHLFIVIHALKPDLDDPQGLIVSELHTFLGANYLVTVHDEPIDCIDSTWRRLSLEVSYAKRGPAFAYYLLADTALSAIFPWFDELLERIENAEDVLLEMPSPEALNEAYQLRRLLTSIRRVLAPQREVFAAILKLDSPLIHKKGLPFFRSVHEDVLRLTELAETAREHIANLREAYASAMTQRTNTVVQRLTLLSAVFLPLTFLTGFFGQNFEALPFTSRGLFWSALVATVSIPIGMFVWFKSRGWW